MSSVVLNPIFARSAAQSAQGYIRVFSFWTADFLCDRPKAANFADLISDMWRELVAASSPYAELLRWDEENREKLLQWPELNREHMLAINLSNILPTSENLDMLRRFYTLFRDRKEQFKQRR